MGSPARNPAVAAMANSLQQASQQSVQAHGAQGVSASGYHQPARAQQAQQVHFTPTMRALSSFNPETTTWQRYFWKMERYFHVNHIIDDETKKTMLFLAIGDDNEALLWDGCGDSTPDSLDYAELCQILTDHYSEKRSEIAERYEFFLRKQRPEESIKEYVAALRKSATYCDFTNNGAWPGRIEEALRDALVFGLHENTVRQALLTELNLTLDKAIKIAESILSASKSKLMGQSEGVHRLASAHKKSQDVKCYRCGGNRHKPDDCPFRQQKCFNCNKIGHTQSVCKNKSQKKGFKPKPKPKAVHCIDDDDYDDLDYVQVYSLSEFDNSALIIDVVVHGIPISMEVDTGSARTLIPKSIWQKLKSPKLEPADTKLRTFSGNVLKIKGCFKTKLSFKDKSIVETVMVVDAEGPSLLGRDALSKMVPGWRTRFDDVNFATTSSFQKQLFQKFAEVFNKEMGVIKTEKIVLELKEKVKPKFYHPRPIPYAIRETVKEMLNKLVEDKVLERVEVSDWAAPLVIVPKSNGHLRLCGDYKVTVNPHIQMDRYPLPIPEDIYATLDGAKVFAKLDLSQAYHQLELDEASKQLTTINTPFGLFRYNRLPFGIAVAPAKFQRIMEKIVGDLPFVKVFLDDLLVAANSKEESWQRVAMVLERLQAAGVRLKQDKCIFEMSELPYLGHIVSAEGLKASKNKIKAILKMSRPRSLKELRTFLGLVNYYGKFLPNLSHEAHSLNLLLKKQVKFHWGVKQNQCWKKLRELLSSPPVLCHYSLNLPLKVDCDASPYGVAAVISHVFPDGGERPIAFASRSLSSAEKNYSQIDKEALAIIFGVKKFHAYLYGRRFTLVTDHKPLLSLLGERKEIPALAAARMQRWAVILSSYDYKLSFRKTEEHCNVDALSRFPIEESHGSEDGNVNFIHLGYCSSLMSGNVTAKKIVEETAKDPILKEVIVKLKNGFKKEDKEGKFAHFYSRRHELTLERQIILYGRRMVIPKSLQSSVLSLLHEEHCGISRMKGMARSLIWWPKIDHHIAAVAMNCKDCQETRNQSSSVSKEAKWPTPPQPWHRVHADFAEFKGLNFLVIVDAYSKWPEVLLMTKTTASLTVEVLSEVFARLGLPAEMVTDNGPQFSSGVMREFMERNGIRHLMGAPYHPQTNGLAERFVQTLKKYLKKTEKDALSTKRKVAKFLLRYRNTPHATTQKSPANVLMGKQLRSRFDLMSPPAIVPSSRNSSKFSVDDGVLARDFREGKKWQKGKIVKQLGQYLFAVESEGRVFKRHEDQLLPLTTANEDVEEEEALEPEEEEGGSVDVAAPASSEAAPIITEAAPTVSEAAPTVLRRSARTRNAPQRFGSPWTHFLEEAWSWWSHQS